MRLPETAWPAYGSIYLCAVAVVAVTSGWKNAIVSLVVGAVLLDYFFVGPADSLSIPSADDWAVFLSFAISSILVAVAIEWRRASEKRLKLGLRLAQAQMDLAEARMLAGLREASGETPVGAGLGVDAQDDQRRLPVLIGQVVRSLERNAEAISMLADLAPLESAPSLRDTALKVEALSRDLAVTSRRMAGPAPAAGLDEPALAP